MKAKAYTNFKDTNGNEYGFGDFMSFATFWFSVPYRVAVRRFDAATFKALNRAAVTSKEARRPIAA